MSDHRSISILAVVLLATAVVLPGQAERRVQRRISPIAWKAEENSARVAAVRALVRNGELTRALRVLDRLSGSRDELVERVSARVERLHALREQLLTDALAKKRRLVPVVDGRRRGGRLVARDGDTLTLSNRGKRFEVSVSGIGAGNLASELQKGGYVTDSDWLTGWLAWLDGKPCEVALRDLPASPELDALRADLSERFDPDSADVTVALELARIMALAPASESESAFGQAEQVIETVQKHAKHPLFASRRGGLRDIVARLAAAAFVLDDPRCLPFQGKVRFGEERWFDVTYSGTDGALRADLKLDAELTKAGLTSWGEPPTGETALTHAGDFYKLAGKGFFVWPARLRGECRVVLRFKIEGSGRWGIVYGARPDGAYLRCTLGGGLTIWDPRTDRSIQKNGSGTVSSSAWNLLVLTRSPEGRFTANLNGADMTSVDGGKGFTAGVVGLMCFTDNPLIIDSLLIEGRIDPAETPRLRREFVDRIVARLP